MMRKIEVSELKKDPSGGYKETRIGNFNGLRIVFGSHYFIEVHRSAKGSVKFVLGATHHGFMADASERIANLRKLLRRFGGCTQTKRLTEEYLVRLAAHCEPLTPPEGLRTPRPKK